MSSRSLRRALLQSSQDFKGDEEEENGPPIVESKDGNLFDLLDQDDVSEPADYEGIESDFVPTPLTPILIRNEKKSKPKGTTVKAADDVLENLQQDFACVTTNPIYPHLVVDWNSLNAEGELKSKTTLNKNVKTRSMGLAAELPRKEWGSLLLVDMQLRLVRQNQAWHLESSEDYERIVQDVRSWIMTADVEGLLGALPKHNCHVELLLAVSDLFRHQNSGNAGSLASKAVHLLGKLLTSGLDIRALFSEDPAVQYVSYDQDELGRVLYLALFRHAGFLIRRGCWLTALQVCKALWWLDPLHDPLAIHLCLEYLALQLSDYGLLHELQRFYEQHSLRPPATLFLSRLFSSFPDAKCIDEWASLNPEAIKLLTSDKSLSYGPDLGRVYYWNQFSLWKAYCGHLLTPQILGCLHGASRRHLKGSDTLEQWQLPLYRHQALVQSEFDNLRLTFPSRLLAQPITLHNPFPPFGESFAYDH